MHAVYLRGYTDNLSSHLILYSTHITSPFPTDSQEKLLSKAKYDPVLMVPSTSFYLCWDSTPITHMYICINIYIYLAPILHSLSLSLIRPQFKIMLVSSRLKMKRNNNKR